MKMTKKLLALTLALVMVLSLTGAALAEEQTYKLTLNKTNTGHTYEVYQIFTGTLTIDGTKKVLSDVAWATGVSCSGIVIGKDESNNDITSTDATKIADALSKNSDLLDTLIANITLGSPVKTVVSQNQSTEISGLAPGYYLVKDKDGSLTGTETYTKYIVQIVGDTVAEVKSGTASSYKKVKDIADSTSTTTYTDWQDSADYDIGDDVPFQLVAVVGSDYDNYTSYQLTFHDKQCDGLTFKKDSVKVYSGDTEIHSDNYSIVTEGLQDECTFEIRFNDLKDITSPQINASSMIRVEYNATLNAKAEIGATGNPNEMHITFSNNPYDVNSKGQTPKDKVIVFTYQVEIKKTDENDKPLTGASFNLSKVSADHSTVVKDFGTLPGTESNPISTFAWKGLDDGEYKLEEITAPNGYNKLKNPIYFTVAAEHDTDSADPKLTSLSGDMSSGKVSIEASGTTQGEPANTVVNQAGSTLPSTGGMGTTLFYVLGSVLVLGAVVLLVSKKRMSKAE